MKNNEKNKVQVLSFNFFVLCSIVTVCSHLHLLCVDSKNRQCSFVENTHILGVFCLIFFSFRESSSCGYIGNDYSSPQRACYVYSGQH